MAVKDGNGGYAFSCLDVVRHHHFQEPCADVPLLRVHVHWLFIGLRTWQPVEGE